MIPNPPIVKGSRNRNATNPPTGSPGSLFIFFTTDFFHCSYCEQLFEIDGFGVEVNLSIKTNHPKDILERVASLTNWLQDFSAMYLESLHADLPSLKSLQKPIGNWIRQYPSIFINRRVKYTGCELDELERLVADAVIKSGEI